MNRIPLKRRAQENEVTQSEFGEDRNNIDTIHESYGVDVDINLTRSFSWAKTK